MRKLILSAGLAVLGVAAQAIAIDQQAKVILDKSENNTRLSVKFSGASVAMVELRLNGTSIGSSKLGSSITKGDVTFALDLSALHDGDNTIEVRLFDASGNLVGTERSIITTEVAQGPVHLAMPKMGSTVQGAIEIQVGLGRVLKGVFVSYFVDNQFRAMTNSAPYTYIWDTQADANGWHEVEAWVVDDTSNTYKTRKTKVFVNNPGGRTERQIPKVADVKPISNPSTIVTGPPAGLKTAPIQGAAASIQATNIAPGLRVGSIVSNPSRTEIAKSMPVRASKPAKAMAAGVKLTTPSTPVLKPIVKPIVKPTIKRSTIKITTLPKVVPTPKTTKRLPDFGSYTILLNSSVVNFDVSPRVENGIPLTPFRHLFEKAGGKVDWDNIAKAVDAKGDGKEVYIKIGDRTARVNKLDVSLEIAPFLERGRTVVPLSFIKEALGVEVEYDPKTGHVLITTKK